MFARQAKRPQIVVAVLVLVVVATFVAMATNLRLPTGVGASQCGNRTEATICISGRAWPDVYLLGQQKAGTSTLSMDLMEAGLSLAAGQARELHLFDDLCEFFHDDSMNEDLFHHGFAVDCPDVSAEGLNERFGFRSCGMSPQHVSDMTPLNLRLLGLPKLLSNVYGDSRGKLKFIVALRNPLVRFQSGYYHVRKNETALPVESFGAYVQMLKGSWPDLQSSGNVSRAYKADQLYRSMYGAILQPWLRTFPPRQFAILAMEHYFPSLDARLAVLSRLEAHFDIGLQAHRLRGLRHRHQGQHASPEHDLDTESRQWLDTTIFGPDRHLLADLLASGLDAGLLFPGYSGAHRASDVLEFLNWGP